MRSTAVERKTWLTNKQINHQASRWIDPIFEQSIIALARTSVLATKQSVDR